MSISDLPVFQALKTKMQWHQARQQVLAQNVANADTPGYVGGDLKAPVFSKVLEGKSHRPVQQSVTQPGHLRASSATGFKGDRGKSFEMTPDGNTVVLEEQMMKVTGNQMDYQAVTSLYARGLGLLKTAIGKA